MARKTIVTLEDDLDGGPADETVRFALGGQQYEIDLSEKNAARLRKQFAPFIRHARQVRQARPARQARAAAAAPRRARTVASRQRSAEIRAWAIAQGIELSDRGRIPADVIARYRAAARSSSRR